MVEFNAERLMCTVTWSMGRVALERLLAGGQAFRFLRLDVGGQQRARVTITSTARRVDFEGETLFGSAVSLVDNGATVTCLDHARREKLTIEHDWVPTARFESPVVAVSEPSLEPATLPDGWPGAVIVVLLEEPAMGSRYRHRLLVDPGERPGSLAVRLLELLLGDAAVHAASGYPFEIVTRLLEETGAPAGGTMDLLNPEGEVVGELGGFRITELHLGAGAGPQDLDGGEYRDLRTTDRAGELAARLEAGESPTDLPSTRIESRTFTQMLDATVDDTPGASGSEEMAQPIRNGGGRDGGGGGDNRPPPPPRPPQPPMTMEAAFGLLLEQRLLDELLNIINRGLGPLAGTSFGFNATSGLAIDWLAKAQASVLAWRDTQTGEPIPARGLGALLYCLLHDEEPPAVGRGYMGPSARVAGGDTIRGRGLLDREAMKDAKRRVVSGTLTSAMLARLPSSVRTALTAAGTDWGALSPSDRLQVAFAVLMETYGTLILPSPLLTTFSYNADNLIVGGLTNWTGTFTLPPAPVPAMPGACPLVTSLRCRTNGIDGRLMLGRITLTGTLIRRLGSTTELVLALAPIVPLFFPEFTWVLPLLAGIALFVALDSATVTMSLSGISADWQLRFVSDGTGILQPRIALTLTASMTASIVSNIPTGINQIVDLVLTAVANSGRLLLDTLGTALGNRLTRVVREAFGGGFPAALFNLGVPITSSQVAGSDDHHLYLESRLVAPPYTTVPMRSVRADARNAAVQDANRLVSADPQRHYLSIVSSENTINVLLAAAFRRGEFNVQIFDPGTRNTLRMLAPPPYPSAPVHKARVFVAAPPRLMLAQGVPVVGMEHGTLVTSMLLALEADADHRYEWAFQLTAPTQVVIGSASASTTPKVQLQTGYLQPIDVLLDLAQATAQVTSLQAVEITRHTVTETTTDPRGHPVTRTYEETEETSTSYALTPQAAASHAPLALAAARFAFRARDTRRSPRKDGVSGNGAPVGPADPITQLTYRFDAGDPDGTNATNTDAYVVADLGFVGGLLFHHVSLIGRSVVWLDPINESLLLCDIGGQAIDLALGGPDLDPKIEG